GGQTTGLTINGGATTTGNAYFGSAVTVVGNSTLGQATTTNLAVSTIVAGNLLKTTTGGALIAATAGVDYALPSAIFGYPFPSNATTTLIAFNGGLTTTNASSSNEFSGRVTGNVAAFGQT